MNIIPVEEATAVFRPEPVTAPWTWSEPIAAIVSNSYRWSQELLTWPEVLEAARCAVEDLYRCGFAVVKVQDEGEPS